MKKIILAIVVLVSFACKQESQPIVSVINVDQFEHEIKSQDVQLIDVRTPEEFAEGYIGDAQNMDVLDSINFKTQIEGLDKSKPVYLYCRSGNRSQKAAKVLHDEGFEEIIDLEGGYLAWIDEH